MYPCVGVLAGVCGGARSLSLSLSWPAESAGRGGGSDQRPTALLYTCEAVDESPSPREL